MPDIRKAGQLEKFTLATGHKLNTEAETRVVERMESPGWGDILRLHADSKIPPRASTLFALLKALSR